ncbi:hypothetical protein AB4Z54_66045, partial [Streptomyces sp. MCAF7]
MDRNPGAAEHPAADPDTTDPGAPEPGPAADRATVDPATVDPDTTDPAATDPADTAADRGAPVGRRVVLGMLALGAGGMAAAPWLQRRLEKFLAVAAENDPTGVTGLLPNGGGFRYYSVTSSVPHK